MKASSGYPQHRLSVCMIVRNEAQLLGRCLESVEGCADEIIVVDTGSTDATASIAQGAGAQVIRSDWRDDFSYSRNISIRAATGVWILWLDADDVVPGDSIPKINSLKETDPARVYGFIVRNEKPGNTGSAFLQARMFPNRVDIFFERRIHEQMMPSALRAGFALAETDAIIEHHGYADPATVRTKAARNATLLLEEWNNVRPDAVMALEIAESYTLLGEWAKARHWYAAVLTVDGIRTVMPQIASQACLGLGNMCNRDERHAEAAQWLTQCLALCPHRPDALFSLAVAQDLGGNLAAAAATLRMITAGFESRRLAVGVDQRESRIKAYLRLERVLFDLDKGNEALVMAKEAIAALPKRPEILDMAGRVYLKLRMLTDALHAFEQSLSLNTESNLEAYMGLSRIFALAGRRETAIQTMTAIRPQFGDRPAYWAFRRILTGPSGDAGPPPEVDKDKINEETAALRKLYGIG